MIWDEDLVKDLLEPLAAGPEDFRRLYMGEFISAAPSWRETSLIWLEENYPEYLGGRGSPAERLTKALRKASYLLAESGMKTKVQEAAIEGRVEVWGQQQHDEMRGWFDAGGFESPAPVAPVTIMTPDGPETIDIVMPNDAETEEAERAVAPPSQHKQTLEEAVERSLLEQDERYGSW